MHRKQNDKNKMKKNAFDQKFCNLQLESMFSLKYAPKMKSQKKMFLMQKFEIATRIEFFFKICSVNNIVEIFEKKIDLKFFSVQVAFYELKYDYLLFLYFSN